MADFRVKTIQRPATQPEPKNEPPPPPQEPEQVAEDNIPGMWDILEDDEVSDESILEVEDIPEFIRKRLYQFGIKTVGDANMAYMQALQAIPGVGPARAEEIKEAVGDGNS
jgi:ERCC4-type nuclease